MVGSLLLSPVAKKGLLFLGDIGYILNLYIIKISGYEKIIIETKLGAGKIEELPKMTNPGSIS
jgi:hypothetical protein